MFRFSYCKVAKLVSSPLLRNEYRKVFLCTCNVFCIKITETKMKINVNKVNIMVLCLINIL